MKTLTAYFIVGILFTSQLWGQTLSQTYQIKALGSKIGSMNSSRQTIGQDVYYHNNALLEVNLLIKKIRMTAESKTHYRAGQLISSRNEVVVNGEVHSTTTIEWQGNNYRMQVNDSVYTPLTSPVFFSGSVLYYKEPVNIRQAFSESSGLYMDIKPQGGSVYQVVDPRNNRDMIHYYKNGVQTQISIKHPLLTLHMIREDLGTIAK